MKFYIAGSISKKDLVKKIHDFVTSRGHTYTSDWVKEKVITPYKENKKASSLRAEKCLDSINFSDVFVLISDESGTGMYIELGVALQLAETKNKPQIYVIGEYNTRSVFFFHPLIKRLENIEHVLEDLKAEKS